MTVSRNLPLFMVPERFKTRRMQLPIPTTKSKFLLTYVTDLITEPTNTTVHRMVLDIFFHVFYFSL